MLILETTLSKCEYQMLTNIEIKNYKSIKHIEINVGKFNVLIGENGAGKSNFLEAIASISAINANKFNNEFMLSRGIRIVESENLFSCFNTEYSNVINITVTENNENTYQYEIYFDKEEPYAPLKYKKIKARNDDFLQIVLDDKQLMENWFEKIKVKIEANNNEFELKFNERSELVNFFETVFMEELEEKKKEKKKEKKIETEKSQKEVSDFVIFSPELSSLRNNYSESQIEPLGIKGEGLFRLLEVMQKHEKDNFDLVRKTLEMFQWVETISLEE